MIRAGDIMSEEVIVVQPDMSVRQVVHLMLRDRVSGFPVVDKVKGLVGVITMQNFIRMVHSYSQVHQIDEFYRNLRRIQEKSVEDFLAVDFVTITPDTDLHEILQLLIDHDVGTFPVMENGHLVGIVSGHDIMNAIFSFDPDS